mmetsp:Transcript_11097/g.22684  ORF Transcript_11097/g.22684 Transcript_11097/m.22684 type:complete len:100 (-) Transcript_11097:426-725(-)
MRLLLTTLGVKGSEISPFCRDFESLVELRDAFIAYCPSTFSYQDVNGTGDADTIDDNENQQTAKPAVEDIVEGLRQLTADAEEEDDADEVVMMDTDEAM